MRSTVDNRPSTPLSVTPKDMTSNHASLLLLFCFLGLLPVAHSQGDRRESLAGEKTAERSRREEMPENYNINTGSVAFAG